MTNIIKERNKSDYKGSPDRKDKIKRHALVYFRLSEL